MISIHFYAHFPIFPDPLAHPPFWRKSAQFCTRTPDRPSGSVQKTCSTKIARTPTQIFVIFGAFVDFSKKTHVFRASGRAPRYKNRHRPTPYPLRDRSFPPRRRPTGRAAVCA